MGVSTQSTWGQSNWESRVDTVVLFELPIESSCQIYYTTNIPPKHHEILHYFDLRRHGPRWRRHVTNESYGSLEEHATNLWTTTTTRCTTRSRWTTTTSPTKRYVQENDDENDVEENVQRRLIKPLRKHGFILI